MELVDLFQVIQSTLTKQGFKLSSLTRNSMEQAEFILDTELEHKKVSEIAGYEAFYGNCMEVRKCPHRNGSKTDTSYYLAIEEVDRSSFKDYKKVKLMRSQTEPTLVKKITKLVLEYKEIVQTKKFEKMIDSFMDEIR